MIEQKLETNISKKHFEFHNIDNLFIKRDDNKASMQKKRLIH